jgi:nitrogen regulatory protein P-II 1
MQLVSAILPTAAFPAVKDALFRAGITGMTVTPVPAHGLAPVADPGQRAIKIRFRRMVRIEVVVAHAVAPAAVDAIRAGTVASRSPGEGEIVVRPVERAIRIRTGETDKHAILPYDGSRPRRGLRLE